MLIDKKLIIGICDDNSLIFEKVNRELKKLFQEIGMSYEFIPFQEVNDLFAFCKNNPRQMDLIFMDIELEGITGIEVSKKLKEMKEECQIAYHTNYLSYATDVYETSHCYYILKEQLAERLPAVIAKVIQYQEDAKILIDVHAAKEVISKRQILYLERNIKKTYIYLENNHFVETRLKLNELLVIFNSINFVRCHNSFAVAFPKVKKYFRHKFLMENDVEISISRNYAEDVKEAFAKWSRMQF